MVVKPMEFFMVRICMKVLFALSSCRVCGLFVSCEEPILRPSGGIGRRSGLKIPWGLLPVRVRVPPRPLEIVKLKILRSIDLSPSR